MNSIQECDFIRPADKIYWARAVPNCGIYEVVEARVHSVQETYIVAVDVKNKYSYLFSAKDINERIFATNYEAMLKLDELMEFYKTHQAPAGKLEFAKEQKHEEKDNKC